MASRTQDRFPSATAAVPANRADQRRQGKDGLRTPSTASSPVQFFWRHWLRCCKSCAFERSVGIETLTGLSSSIRDMLADAGRERAGNRKVAERRQVSPASPEAPALGCPQHNPLTLFSQQSLLRRLLAVLNAPLTKSAHPASRAEGCGPEKLDAVAQKHWPCFTCKNPGALVAEYDHREHASAEVTASHHRPDRATSFPREVMLDVSWNVLSYEEKRLEFLFLIFFGKHLLLLPSFSPEAGPWTRKSPLSASCWNQLGRCPPWKRSALPGWMWIHSR